MGKPRTGSALLAAVSALSLLSAGGALAQVVTGNQDFTIVVQEGADTTPDSFAMGGYNAPVNSLVTLGPIPLSGFDQPVAISVSGSGSPEYSLDGGVTFTSAPGQVSSGDQVYLRAASSLSSNQNVDVSLSVGDVTETFRISTASAQAEQFVTVFDQTPSSMNGWRVATGDVSAHIGKTGRFVIKHNRTGQIYGDMQFDDVRLGTTFWDLSSQSVAMQFQRSNTTSGRSTYGSVGWENIPSSNGVAPARIGWKSSAGTPTANTGVSFGYTGSGQVFSETSLSGATGASGGAWLRSPQVTVDSGTFSFAYGAYGSTLGRLTAYLYLPQIGSPLTANYPVSVSSFDLEPDAFSFASVTGAAQGAVITSDPVTISGINATVPVSVSGDGSPEIRVGSGSWGSGPASVQNGQTVTVRLSSSPNPQIERVATVTVGSLSETFSVTTGGVEPCASSPSVGTVCGDGSVYVGAISGVDRFTTSTNTLGLLTADQGEAQCQALGAGWYLPNLTEMNLMLGVPSLTWAMGVVYWTSTPDGSLRNYVIDPDDGSTDTYMKAQARNVRCMKQ